MSNEKYYRNLSEIYNLQYNDQIEVAENILVIQGIVTEMLSDSIAFEKKHGNTESLKRSNTRLDLLMKKINLLSAIQTDSYAQKLINRRLMQRIIKLESQLQEDKRLDDMILQFENTELPSIPEIL